MEQQKGGKSTHHSLVRVPQGTVHHRPPHKLVVDRVVQPRGNGPNGLHSWRQRLSGLLFRRLGQVPRALDFRAESVREGPQVPGEQSSRRDQRSVGFAPQPPQRLHAANPGQRVARAAVRAVASVRSQPFHGAHCFQGLGRGRRGRKGVVGVILPRLRVHTRHARCALKRDPALRCQHNAGLHVQRHLVQGRATALQRRQGGLRHSRFRVILLRAQQVVVAVQVDTAPREHRCCWKQRAAGVCQWSVLDCGHRRRVRRVQ